MESLDYEQKKNNIIITGVSEIDNMPGTDGSTLTNDDEKIRHVLKVIGQEDVLITAMVRLGKTPDVDRNMNQVSPKIKHKEETFYEQHVAYTQQMIPYLGYISRGICTQIFPRNTGA